MLRSTPVDAELGQRIYWLVQLRWLASSAVIYGTFLATGVVGVKLDPMPLYLIGGAIAVYNSLFLIALKWADLGLSTNRLKNPRFMANLQIVVDLLFLTLLIHFSGGAENLFAFYFIFHVIIASILLSRRETFFQASLGIALYGGLVVGEYWDLVPHVHVFGPSQPDLAREGVFVGSSLLVFASTLYLAAYMATSIMGRLRERDREILQLTGELERKARELEEAYHQLADLERIKSEHLRKISHEIKAPLGSAQESLKTAMEGLAGEVPQRQRELIAGAEKRVEGLLHLVGDLLILSRARDARAFTNRRAIDPLGPVVKVVADCNVAAASRGIVLSTEVQGNLHPIFAEPEALEQLLANLLENAINYTPAGGKVGLKVDTVGTALRFQVKDTGIGIPAADLPKVFAEFYRAENARRFSEEGTGLGLSIVRGIVDTHGGEIEVDSRVGMGTTFTVILPCGTAPSETSVAEQSLSVEEGPPAPMQGEQRAAGSE